MDITEILRKIGDIAVGTPETALSLASGAIAYPAAKFGGALTSAMTGGRGDLAQYAEDYITDKMTYKPTSQSGQEAMNIAGSALSIPYKPAEYVKEKYGYIPGYATEMAINLLMPRLAGRWSEMKAKGLGQTGLYGGDLAKTMQEARARGEYPPGSFSNLADKKVRMEIDDSGFKAKTMFDAEMDRRKNGLPNSYNMPFTLAEVVDHPTLFKEYPDLANVKVNFSSGVGGAAYDPSTNTISMTTAFTKKDTPQFLHEIQHAIQEKEGFARGGVPKQFDELPITTNEAVIGADIGSITHPGEWKQIFGPNNPLGIAISAKQLLEKNLLSKAEVGKLEKVAEKHGFDSFDSLMGYLKTKNDYRSDVSQYTRLAGEIEARDAAARMNLTPQERMRTGPYTSEDIPLLDWIVMKGSGGTAAMKELPQKVTPMKLDKTVKSDEGYSYHATNIERLFDIAKEGRLRTHKPWEFTDQDVWPDGSTSKRSYFSNNAGIVWQFAPEEGTPVVIRTKASSLKRESTGDMYSDKPISAKYLEYLGEDGLWHPVRQLKGE